METCQGCRRDAAKCVCDPEPPEDVLFHQAAEKGFEPLTDDARESFREKAGVLLKGIGGRE